MTTREMYERLFTSRGYKTDGYYPSTRYGSCHGKYEAWWRPVNDDYNKIIKEHIGKKDDTMDFNNTMIMVDGHIYNAHDITVTTEYGSHPVLTASAHINPFNETTAPTRKCNNNTASTKIPTIENVIFNPPATIVFWSDKTKTIVKCDYEYETYDPEKGIAMAIAKKLMGDNKGHYYELFKHWREKWDKQNEVTADVKINIPKTPLNDLSEKIASMFNGHKELVIDDLIP